MADFDLERNGDPQLLIEHFITKLKYYATETFNKAVIANESKFNSLLQEKISSELYSFLISKYSLSVDNKSSSLFLDKSIGFLSNLK